AHTPQVVIAGRRIEQVDACRMRTSFDKSAQRRAAGAWNWDQARGRVMPRHPVSEQRRRRIASRDQQGGIDLLARAVGHDFRAITLEPGDDTGVRIQRQARRPLRHRHDLSANTAQRGARKPFGLFGGGLVVPVRIEMVALGLELAAEETLDRLPELTREAQSHAYTGLVDTGLNRTKGLP